LSRYRKQIIFATSFAAIVNKICVIVPCFNDEAVLPQLF